MAAAAAKPHFSPHAAFSSSSPSAAPSAADAEPDFVVFRLLLPPSFSDADTMRLYAAVNPLPRRPPPPRRGLLLEALVAVLDAEGALYRAEEGPRGGGAPGRATCLLLAEAERFEAATGRGVLGRIAREAGAVVRVVPWEEAAPLPQGHPPEEVVEITGDRTAVRKALVALSSCLQGDQPVDGSATSFNKDSSMLSWASSEVPERNVGVLRSEASTEFAQGSVVKADGSECNTGDARSRNLQQIAFRLLLPINLAGGLIGKKGLIIKGIEDETGACIDVSTPIAGCRERVITICALESPDSECHIVQSALLLIFDRMMEVESNARSTFEKTSQFSARALVLKHQFDCLVGLGGSIIKEMVNATGGRIQILDDTDVPQCASSFELVIEITGELMNVRDALCLVCWKLRNHVFSSSGTDCTNGHVPSSDGAESNATSQANIHSTSKYSMDNAHRVDHGPSLSYGMDSVENTFSSLDLTSSEIQKLDHGNGVMINNSDDGIQKPTDRNDVVTKNLNHGILFPEENNLLREVPYAAITRITYETAVSGTILNLVCGDNGNNLAQLTEMSGADIAVYNPPSEGNEAMIVVSGPPEQAQSAQRGLVELILQGQ
ncbi:hypothetical protein HU200_039442 [Digitaria exilis]|uniref:K Homology domain-containing protein n=1 Tax=Digitaria exilis TaxID=1010633 RepID=A0A835EHE4_9POAL|nr:hypothetical protein HU200_039442 [Digitaria exilis]